MREVKNINEIIENFPMYSNLTLPEDVKLKLDDTYNALLIWRDSKNNSSDFPINKEVCFIEDAISLQNYLKNIFFKEKQKALVFEDIYTAGEELDKLNIIPKIFFIDVSAIGEHKDIINLIDCFPNSKIILMSGISEYIEGFLRELSYIKRGLKIDYIFNRNLETIKLEIEQIKKEEVSHNTLKHEQ